MNSCQQLISSAIARGWIKPAQPTVSHQGEWPLSLRKYPQLAGLKGRTYHTALMRIYRSKAKTERALDDGRTN